MSAPAPICIALLGAESSGKSTLAMALQQHLQATTGLRVARVDEFLREWCDAHGRTPQKEEQAGIAAEQQARIDAAKLHADLVLTDTSALMTALYSELIFGDPSLLPAALQAQRSFDLNLLMALDLPWQADGLQRDGPHVQRPVDQRLRQLMRAAGLPWAVISGQGEARLEAALDALTPLLQNSDASSLALASGLFTRLAGRQARLGRAAWRCEGCDDPACEQALRRLQRSNPA